MSAAHIETERLTDIVGGRPNRSDGEAAHLAECADCRLELDMLAAARGLGVASLTAFDPRRVAAGVQGRLAGEGARAPKGRRMVPWLAGLAAAAVVVLAVRTGSNAGGAPGGTAAPAAVSVLHELDELSEPQLEEVLASLPPSTEAPDLVELAPLSDLNTTDLELMLRSMEEP